MSADSVEVSLLDTSEATCGGRFMLLRESKLGVLMSLGAADTITWDQESFEVTDEGLRALAFYRERQAIAGRCTMAEQVAAMRHSPDDSSSAQPHRFKETP